MARSNQKIGAVAFHRTQDRLIVRPCRRGQSGYSSLTEKKSRWGIHHMGCWREVEAIRDTYGNTRVACNGNLISNPIMWASS
jgi:hypothetical protein